jgi:hypothetical protein
MLNEFITGRGQRPTLAWESGSWGEAKTRQLTRGREFLGFA